VASFLRRLRKLIRKSSFEREDGSNREHPMQNVDAMAAQGSESNFPPNYVKSYDEGRPRR